MNLDTIKTELKEYILDSINDYDDVDKLKIINNIYLNELHHELFNIDYYIIGTYKCKEWLTEEHKISPFVLFTFIGKYEFDNFGQKDMSKYLNDDYSYNYEKIVNMLVYIIGEELIYNMEDEILETIE